MKISVLQENILKPLLFTAKTASVKIQLPITQHILLQGAKGALRFASTNTETTTVVDVAAKIEKEGGICVPAKLFTEIISSFPQGKIDLTEEKMVLTLEGNRYKAEIPGIAKEEFPPVPRIEKKSGRVGRELFFQALQSVLFSAATDEGRPILTGVKMVCQKDQSLFVATDGYRLSLRKIAVALPEDFDRTIPARALQQVMGFETEEKELVMGETGDGQLAFMLGDAMVFTRSIDGEYPAFEKIIPKTANTTVVLDKEEFLRAVKVAAIFARDSANIVRLRVGNNSVTVSANTPQVGEGSVELAGKTKGEDADIAFNSRFLLEFLGNFHEEKVVFEMTGSLNPGVFKPENDDSYLHIIMPVRVQG